MITKLTEQEKTARAIGAIKRLVREVKEYRQAQCPMKDCLVNRIIGGNDIDLADDWLKNF